LVKFLNRLTSVKILDPACGSGNFLYVTLEHLKRLEGEVLAAINGFGQTGLLDLAGGTTVGPRQLLGLELNPRAAAIADVVLRIGYLQWHIRTHGLTQMPEPLLTDDHNIRQQDAALHHGPPVPRLDAQGQPVTRWDGFTMKEHSVTGLEVPDETAQVTLLDYPNAEPASWPEADFIVGNPPFVGMKKMRLTLGDGYAEALRQAYNNEVPESSDLVMYWWYKAAKLLRDNSIEKFGFITTYAITSIFNRRVVESFLTNEAKPISFDFAIPNHPWVDGIQGADTRIAIATLQRGQQLGKLVTVSKEFITEDGSADVELSELDGDIHSDLTIGADITTAIPLKSNDSLCYLGVKLYGLGFIVKPDIAENFSNGTSKPLIKRFVSGQDLTQKDRNLFVIDADGISLGDLMSKHSDAAQHLLLHVKPERDHNPRKAKKERWWLFGENQPSMRKAIAGLARYIVTTETAKHRLFQFVPNDWVAEGKIVVIALDDLYVLGVLSSRIHTMWADIAGGRLGVGNTPIYNKTRCFDPFPFPDATPAQQARIRELAETIDTHRKRQQAQHPGLTLTNLYNVVEQLRAGQPLTPKEQATNQQGLASVLLSLHNDLDAAVADAYGWPITLPDAELLAHLVALNHARAAEEKAGTMRYLRPAYQAPGQQQAALALPTTGPAAVAAADTTAAQPWPSELAQQMQAVRAVVAQAAAPVTAAQVAARFRRTRATQVQPLLATLTALSLLRHLEPENAYAA
jgi:hypothetical protein